MIYLLQYVRGTVAKGIRFIGSASTKHTFTDADCAGDILTRKSTTGCIVIAAGGHIAWLPSYRQ